MAGPAKPRAARAKSDAVAPRAQGGAKATRPQSSASAPLVSMIIPVYNAEASLERAVRSLLANTYERLEIIVVNDGSTDGSLAVGQALAKKHRQVKLFDQPNGGASAARNTGLQQARGEYIGFLDADDQVEPDFIATLVKMMQPGTALVGAGMWRRRDSAKKATRLYAHHLRAREDKESQSEYVLYLLGQDGRLYPVVNKLFRGEVIRQNHLGFDPTWDFAEDTKFVLEYLAFAEGEIEFTNQPLYIYNQDTVAGTVAGSSLYWRNWQKSLDFVKAWVRRQSDARTTTVRERERLKKLESRWRISHALAVGRTKASFWEKCKLLNVFWVIPATIVAKIRG